MSDEQIDRLSGDVAEVQDDIVQVKETLTAHEVRLGNGRSSMSSMRERIEKLEPKAPDWVKLLAAGLAVIGVLMGAQLYITAEFNARPTQGEVDKMTAPIKQAQKETAHEIKEIEKSQSAQQTSIKNIEFVQGQQADKLDVIIERLPPRRPHR
jgi:predicted  nucleic acid-binding Zn-ribbon protein